jgi:hypothetical protein
LTGSVEHSVSRAQISSRRTSFLVVRRALTLQITVPGSPTAKQPQRALPPTDGPEDLDFSMPPKRKNADTSDDMDRPEKKPKTMRKSRKTAPAVPAEEEGKSNGLSTFITSALGA